MFSLIDKRVLRIGVEEISFNIVTFNGADFSLRFTKCMSWLIIRLFHFSCKGLALDLEDGTFVKLAADGTVLR